MREAFDFSFTLIRHGNSISELRLIGAIVMTKYFGTYGIRGRVGEFPITPAFVLRLGYAAGAALVARAHAHGMVEQGKRPAVLIGKDTRISGYLLESALEAGFIAAGVDAGFDWENDTVLQSVTRKAISELGDQGRGLVRASGTEPVVRVMAESRNADAAARWANGIASALDTGGRRD